LASYLIDPRVLEAIPEALARKHKVIPLFKLGNTLTVATAYPMNLTALDELRLKSGVTIEPVVATEAEIANALEEYYGAKGHVKELVEGLTQEKVGLKPGQTPDLKRLQGLVTEPPVVRLVNLIFSDAIRARASDVHLEPEKEFLKVRFRVDGILHDSTTLPKHLEPAVISRIKIMANLDIAERRKPQDGRLRIGMEGHEVDVRVSVMPSIDGEAVVLRLLDSAGMRIGLESLGMSKELLSKYQELLKRAWGILLVTGPTGSGKTTTLYASLATMNAKERNILTIEDPVEYRLAGVRQIQVNPAVDLTFANGLRSILRQDPDVIMVGEIRDKETAEIAIQAALTGHLVFSTLHTNDAPTAITRLLDMGIEPFLVASSVVGVAAQRLVRVICPECKQPGVGCRKCMQTGYKGRIGIFELMVANEELGRMAIAKASTAQLRAYAISKGMKPLREDGMEKVKSGITTQDEVFRVTQEA
jgi:type IV pilus assembly protein PilB